LSEYQKIVYSYFSILHAKIEKYISKILATSRINAKIERISQMCQRSVSYFQKHFEKKNIFVAEKRQNLPINPLVHQQFHSVLDLSFLGNIGSK
jgi:hypothetical protein